MSSVKDDRVASTGARRVFRRALRRGTSLVARVGSTGAAARRTFASPTCGLLLTLQVLSALSLSACSLSPAGLDDPLEPINRQVWALNTSVDRQVEPTLDDAPSGAVWRGIHNVLVNLREPGVFANDLAQGRECAAGASLRRFMVNSTLGVGGIFDVARELGVEAHDNDLGQTFAYWGVPSGPFFMVPLLGPTDLRALGATAIEFFADPVDIAWQSLGLIEVALPLAGADFIDRQLTEKDELDEADRASPDGYAALRAAYQRNLAAAVADDKCPAVLDTAHWDTRATTAGGR